MPVSSMPSAGTLAALSLPKGGVAGNYRKNKFFRPCIQGYRTGILTPAIPAKAGIRETSTKHGTIFVITG